MWRGVWVVVILLNLVGCGFHPRGQLPLAPPLHNVYLKICDPYGQLARNLRQYLKVSCVHIANCPENADIVLEIISEQTTQQLLSVGGTQQTRQYNLILTVTFQLLNSTGCVLLPPTSVSETRTIPILANQVLAGSNEANNLLRRMRLAIVYDIMLRLSSQYVTCRVMNPP